MDLEIVILNEVRNRQISYDFTYMCNLKYGTNELIYQKKKKTKQTQKQQKKENRLTDIENKLMVIKGERGLQRDKLRVWN